jgi:hypothetical protein
MPDFNIPTDIFARSGLPENYRQGLLSSIMPKLNQAVTDFPGIVPQYIEPQTRRFQDVTAEAGKGLLDQLATRNMLGSSFANDAVTNLMKELNQQRFGNLADLSLQAKTAYPSFLGSLAGLGQATEQPLEPYQAMLNFLSTQA